MTMQIKRRIGSAGAPTTLAEGQLAYGDPQVAANDDALYIGSDVGGTPTVRTLVSNTRQVELAGTQTITGVKTFSPTSFHLTGGANNNILATDGAGNVHWTAAPSGGLLNVSTDTTLNGDGTSGSPLSVLHWANTRSWTIQTAAAAGDGAITTIAITPGTTDGSTDCTMTGFAITRLDDGTY